MAHIDNLDQQFAQCQEKERKGACVLVSYGIVIDYFSDHVFSVNGVLDHYAEYAGIAANLPQPNKEDAISLHYHAACEPIDRRGLDYVADIHNYCGRHSACCKTLEVKTSQVTTTCFDRLKNKLKASDRLAIIVYRTDLIDPKTRLHKGHAIVIGWDTQKDLFIIKDPNRALPEIDDLSYYGDRISEYVLFGKS